MEVSLMTEECHVKFDGDAINADKIVECIEDCGFESSVISQDTVQRCESGVVSEGTLVVGGMTCGACVKTVTSQVSELAGVMQCEVSLVTEECHVRFDSAVCTMGSIAECIEDCGFDAKVVSESSGVPTSGNEKKLNLKVFGMTCGACSSSIEEQVSQLRGVKSVSVALSSEDAEIVYDASQVGNRDIIDRIEELGFETVVANTLDNSTQLKLLSKTKEIRFWKGNCIKAGVASFLVMGLYMCVPLLAPGSTKHFPYVATLIPGLYYRDIFGLIITTYVLLTVGSHFYKAAWTSFKHGSGTMDTLIGISTGCAYLFSIYSMLSSIVHKSTKMPKVIFDTAVMLITFISLGKLLENKAKSETSTALSKLISLTPSSCTIRLPDGTSRNIAVELLQTNDIVEITPGMKIPADGIVIQNESEVDESLMTGESMLVEKVVGSHVIGGSVNGPGHFFFRATQVGEDTKLANIISTMKQAQMTKAPIQKYADKMAGVFVPFVLTLSAITFITWISTCYLMENPPAVFNNENGKFFMCLQISISVIIVACPCALGLAAPTAIMVGTGVGANHGVLIKGGDILEKCTSLNVCLFDKTGTLTTGNMSVENFIIYDTPMSDLYWKLISLCETISEHPVAKAVLNYAESNIVSPDKLKLEVIDEKVMIGKGVSCSIKDMETSKVYDVVVGNKKLFSSEKINGAASNLTESFVSINGALLGKFEITDRIKDDAHLVINYLQQHGYRCCMVTGDVSEAALKVAQQVGISANDVFSEVSPEQKREIVIQLQNEGKDRVAFVGDGINDSPALVEADLGISISSGTDIAIEAADIVILDSDVGQKSLKGLIHALDISSQTFHRVKMNFFWAVCYNSFMIPIAMGVLVPWGITLHPMVSSAAMALSSVSVVTSSLMLKRWTPPSLEDSSVKSKSRWFRLRGSRPRNDDIELQERLV